MSKQCPECTTKLVESTPYCEACGYQFWTPPGSLKARHRLKDLVGSVAAGLCIAVVKYLVFG